MELILPEDRALKEQVLYILPIGLDNLRIWQW